MRLAGAAVAVLGRDAAGLAAAVEADRQELLAAGPAAGEKALAEICMLAQAIGDLQTALAGRWQVADGLRAHDAYGWRSLVTAVMNLAQVRKGRAVEWQVVAGQLPRLEATAAALAGGGLSFDNAAAICHSVRHLSDADAVTAEGILLESAAAAGTNTADVAKAGRKINDVVDDGRDPDEPGPAEKQAERQHLSISKLLDGMYRIDGMLDSEIGQLLRNVLEPLAKKIDADDDRPKRRRLAEALLTFLRGGRTAATLHVLIDEADLLAEQARQAGHRGYPGNDDGEGADASHAETGGREHAGEGSEANDVSADAQCPDVRPGADGFGSRGGRDGAERDGAGQAPPWLGGMPPGWRTGRQIRAHGSGGLLPDDQLVPAADVLRMAGSSLIRRVVVNADGIVVDFGRARRLATPDQRAALRTLYRTCVTRGCDVDADHLEVEHVYGWVAENGETNLEELCLICASCRVAPARCRARAPSEPGVRAFPAPRLKQAARASRVGVLISWFGGRGARGGRSCV